MSHGIPRTIPVERTEPCTCDCGQAAAIMRVTRDWRSHECGECALSVGVEWLVVVEAMERRRQGLVTVLTWKVR